MYRLFLFLSLLWGIGESCKTPPPYSAQKQPYSNALIHETSPYLRQHAHNPVNWFAWNDKTLQIAAKEQKLILISIGYAACHWCHVMEKESFEDTAVARVMNDHFVNIKIDREERPDVDNVYMTACQLTHDNGCGWPLNVLALPNGQPIWTGTYQTKKEWLDILSFFIEKQKNENDKLAIYAQQLTQGIQAFGQLDSAKKQTAFSDKDMPFIVQNILKNMDFEKGGTMGTPKFPIPALYDFLLNTRHAYPNEQALKAVTTTLNNMANGGIYDHLQGGFARYATDERWEIPHFEKMLYDNAQLISLYSHAWQVTKTPQYEQVVRQIMNFVASQWTSKEGGFYSSFDADTEGVEGGFYLWEKQEIDHLLGENAALFCEIFDISQAGNWENGKNILYLKKNNAPRAAQAIFSEQDIKKKVESSKNALLNARNKRLKPPLDDKILTAWNALMLKGCIDAYRAFADPQYLDMALKNGNFIAQKLLQKKGRLNRNYKNGVSSINGFLEDYAFTIRAFTALYEVTFDEKWLRYGEKMTDYVFQNFSDTTTGLFHFSSHLDPPLIAQRLNFTDDVIPNANSSFALALHDLGTLLAKKEYTEKAKDMMQQLYVQAVSSGQSAYYYNWCQLYFNAVRPTFEVAIVGKQAAHIRDKLMRYHLPNVLFLGGTTEGSLELLKDKYQARATYIYVCQKGLCKLPVQDVEKALELMRF